MSSASTAFSEMAIGDEAKAIRVAAAGTWTTKQHINNINNNDDEVPVRAADENDNGNSIVEPAEKKEVEPGPPRMGPIPQASEDDERDTVEDDDTVGSRDGSTDEEYDGDYEGRRRPAALAPHRAVATPVVESSAPGDDVSVPTGSHFTFEETFLIFDWDDTVLPSSWVQSQGLRLDESSQVSPAQRDQLTEVANAAAETLQAAKRYGTVVLVTNAERGWIELSCLKFMPTLYPILEQVKILSARTTYDCPRHSSPLDWKLLAFDAEIRRMYGESGLYDSLRRKNVLSLGDSVHEREALMRATHSLPNCRSKSLKFVERPDISQICKQHALVANCFDRIIHHDGNLDLCIRCT